MNGLTLEPDTWYSWQMVPGYGDGYRPYFSPIFVTQVTPRKTGRRIIGLAFINALYAEGVQDCAVDLTILERQSDFIIARLEGKPGSRSAIVSTINFDWIRDQCPGIWSTRPPTQFSGLAADECGDYLNQLFFGARRPNLP